MLRFPNNSFSNLYFKCYLMFLSAYLISAILYKMSEITRLKATFVTKLYIKRSKTPSWVLKLQLLDLLFNYKFRKWNLATF